MKKKKEQVERFHIGQQRILLITFALSLAPIITILLRIFRGDIGFWYDPARDLLAGLANLQDPALIGQISGIPGVFYGPYWIWSLSFGQLFSHDPRIVTFIILTLPYLILFPLLLILLRKAFQPITIAILWLLFLLSCSNYITDLWNPHPAPLLVLLAVYLLFIRTDEINRRNCLIVVFGGLSAGLVINYHLSLGIGMLLGIIVYLLSTSIKKILSTKQKIQELQKQFLLLALFIVGLGISFLPSLLFELRHGFMQTKTLATTLFQYGGSIQLQGLSRVEIIEQFWSRGAALMQTPVPLFTFVFSGLFVYYIIAMKKNKVQVLEELKVLKIALSLLFGILFIYLTARNPVWTYHFIGFEILFLLLIGILINRLQWIKGLAAAWVIILIVNNITALPELFREDVKTHSGSLAAKEHIVKELAKDSNGDYAFYALNPAIYTYDYTYLFNYLDNKNFSYDPGSMPDQSIRYLIIPPESKNAEDFIHYRGSENAYKTVLVRTFPDGTRIIKKVKK